MAVAITMTMTIMRMKMKMKMKTVVVWVMMWMLMMMILFLKMGTLPALIGPRGRRTFWVTSFLTFDFITYGTLPSWPPCFPTTATVECHMCQRMIGMSS